MATAQLCFQNAGHTFRFQLDYPYPEKIETGHRFGNYQVDPEGQVFDGGEYHIRGDVLPVDIPEDHRIFSQNGFHIGRDPETGAIRMASYCLQLKGWQLVADLSADFSSGTIYLRQEIDGKDPNPLHIPMRNHLLHNRFAALDIAICHGSHVDLDGRSLVFIAKSGTGKTTTGLLWQDAGHRLFNDEKNLLFVRDDTAFAATSFWHGSYPITFPGEQPLAGIFLLVQAPENKLVPVPPVRAVARLLANTFSERYHKENFQRVIDTYTAVVERVPVFELHCTPDQRAVEIVKRELALSPQD